MNTDGIIEQDDPTVVRDREEHAFLPVELEAIAKISRTADELNRILSDQGCSMRVEWAATEGIPVAGPTSDGDLITFGV